MADATTPLLGGNDGWAGERGEFAHLSEADVRGTTYVGARPLDGGHPGASASMPYQLARRDPDAPLFEGPYADRLQKILSRYPDRQGALLPVLNLAHEIHGFLRPDDMQRVAETLALPAAYVRGVATFYTMYNKQPVGRQLIQVCTNVACNLCGADEVMEAFLEHTATEPGQISADGEFTVIEAECLGACGFPTAVQINARYFENVSPADVPAILARLRSESESWAVAAPGTAAREG
jgi:NADH-quinone oxidoreductase E subunit